MHQVGIISAVQQRESVLHAHASIFFQILYPHRRAQTVLNSRLRLKEQNYLARQSAVGVLWWWQGLARVPRGLHPGAGLCSPCGISCISLSHSSANGSGRGTKGSFLWTSWRLLLQDPGQGKRLFFFFLCPAQYKIIKCASHTGSIEARTRLNT